MVSAAGRRKNGPNQVRAPIKLKVPKVLAVVSGARLSAPQVPYDYAEPEDVGDENYPADLNSMGSGPYESEFYDPQEHEAASPGRAQEGQLPEHYFNPDQTGSFSKTKVDYRPPDLKSMPDNRPTYQPPNELFTWVPKPPDEEAHYCRPTREEVPVRKPESLPLEWFDDPELETGSPEQFLAARAEGDATPGVPARSRYFRTGGQFTWAPCYVLDYTAETDMYTIQWKRSGTTKQVKRLNLLFDAEDQDAFRTRLHVATDHRDHNEAVLRYTSFIERQPFVNNYILDMDFKQRIRFLAGWDLARKLPHVVQDYLAGVKESYQYSVKKSILDLQLTRSFERELLEKQFNVLQVFERPPVPQMGVVVAKAVGSGQMAASVNGERASTEYFGEDYWDVQDRIYDEHPAVQPNFLKASQHYFNELDIRHLVLMQTDISQLPQPTTVAEFDTLQRAHMDQVSGYLHQEYLMKVTTMMDELGQGIRLDPVTIQQLAGGFNNAFMALPAAEKKEVKRRTATLLPKFSRMVSIVMTDQLRTVVIHSVAAFRKFYGQFKLAEPFRAADPPAAAEEAASPEADAAAPEAEVEATPPAEGVPAEGEAPAAEGEQEAVEVPAKKPLPDLGLVPFSMADEEASDAYFPLFEIELTVTDGKVQFSPSLETLKDTMLAMFDKVITSVEGIADLRNNLSFGDIVAANAFGNLNTVGREEAFVKEARADMEAVLEENLVGPVALADSYKIYDELMSVDADEYIEVWKMGFHTTEETEAEILRLQALAEGIEAQSRNEVTFKLIRVQCAPAKEWLLKVANHLRERLLSGLAATTREQNEYLCQRYSAINERLEEEAADPEALDALRKFLLDSQTELKTLSGRIGESHEVFQVLYHAEYDLEDEDSALLWRTAYCPQSMAKVLRESEARQQQDRVKFMDDLRRDKSQLLDDIEDITAVVEQFAEVGEIEAVEERVAYVQDIEERITAAREAAELFNSREELFKQKPTDYPQLAQIQKDFDPSANLWKTAAAFLRALPQWMDGPFPTLDADQMASDMEKWYKATFKMQKQLTGEPLVVAEKLFERIKDFQTNIPLIQALRNPGLRDRHWISMSEKIGFPVKADASFSVTRAKQLELGKHLAMIEEVSEYASKEFSLERTLDKMQNDWSGVVFEYMAWRETGSYILKGLDETQMLLDDQIIKTQSMRSSPYIGPFEERVRIWEGKLVLVQEIIDEWLKTQSGWVYLEPIFGSEDIMQQMPVEGRKFKIVDQVWRSTMEKLLVTDEVLIVGGDEELVKSLRESNKLLDAVQKGLAEYLETKRLAFPRFYFLSNDELLEILSETKDPLRAQPFLRKVFEAIDKLEFQEDLTVTAMFSEETEKIVFKNTFNPKSAGGNVERWFNDCEKCMTESLADISIKAFQAYAEVPRKQWIREWPGQIVLCIGAMYWTKEVEEAIRYNRLSDYADTCNNQLADIVNLVRGKLTKLERKTLSALVVIDVHAREVVKELAGLKVSDTMDFDWSSQLRYEWTGENKDIVNVRMINAQILYSYEYLGNSGRLVITPLTDRCYRTLMGALHLQLGGAPEGPAGTGKTETTKDLAKAIAMQCIVFNCSDGLDFLAMAKMFKGLAASGAWACLDEFNRIDLEVLSVVAQQILTIVRAKAAKLKMFEFEGTKLQLRDTCNVFITMNPGYAGRSELPDNLKALFRTVAMMVPDYALISEIMLYSSGYLEAQPLAIKLVATYKLCSEQLSSQSHYDYGMRAVISVLRAAAAVKQKFPEQEESILMLRSLKDVNLPKFLAPDVPLFEGILSDLFPGTVLPQPDYDDMTEACKRGCLKMNLQPTKVFLEKTFQLYEMILVRHGLMLVGLSYGAKTSSYRVLQFALGDLCANGLQEENKTRVVAINPKSIYMGQLYGQFDPISHEWQDGILAKKYRECAVDTSPDRKWVLFDGPVDAIWIENMNTVLDDNKKLCLMSGEIISMSASMNMIFEVADLAVASPATVSRCGMIYVEPSQIGWEPLFTSWCNKLPAAIEESKPRVEQLFHGMVQACLKFVRRNCKELVPTADINLPVALMNIFDSLLDKFRDPDNPVKPEDHIEHLECIFLISMVWSIGGSTESEGRDKFNTFFRALVKGEVQTNEDRTDYDLGPGITLQPFGNIKKPFPKEGSVYDYMFDTIRGGWNHWLDTVDVEPIPADAQFQQIVVTTIDTVRYKALLDILLKHERHVMFGGPTGTGKTVYIKDLLEGLDKSKFSNIQSTFSAQTNANMIQDIIDGKLDKRRKGIFGPPFGIKCVIFVDDLNMPMLEVYGAQPPIEILRQWMDYGGWYDRSDISFRKLVDIQFVTAMGPPGGGRNPITARFQRHFNLISVCEFDDSSYKRIYETIIDWWSKSSKLESSVDQKTKPIIAATLDIYNTIRASLLPTPTKSHYTYNMRDLSKVFQGVAMVGTPPVDQSQMVRLWAHESMRVFHDRLIDDKDRSWFFNYLKDMLNKHLGMKFEDVFRPEGQDKSVPVPVEQLNSVIFGDFMVPGADPTKYDEIPNQQKLIDTIKEYLSDYNQSMTTKMDLVLFLYAAQHITRISRVLRSPGGNALLVGVGGSGRQSLTRIAAYMAEYDVFTIEISKSYGRNEWYEDLRKVLKLAGGQAKTQVFLFSDTQLKDESFLEDLNNILNTGEVPNLFPKDEVMQITELVQARAKKVGMDDSVANMFKFFVQECRKNFHMVVAMSPVGDSFRERLRMFPALVNCCTIDWFSEWPSDALMNVAKQFLEDLEMPDDKVKSAIMAMCMSIHESVRKLAVNFKADLSREYYVTPTSYLELITTYRTLLSEKRDLVKGLENRYRSGLSQIYDAEQQVSVMKEELIALQPVLKQTAIETEEMLVVIDRETIEANAKKEVVDKEAAAADVKAAAAKAIKDDCESELAVAMPMLEAALAALDTLTKSDVVEVKAMKSPPAGVKLVMEAVCVMKNIKPQKIKDPAGGLKKVDDYWGPAQTLLADPNFLSDLRTFDKDNIPENIIKAIKPYVANEGFEPQVILKASKAAYGLCCWVRAMEAYDRVAKVVAPKKAKLAESEAEYTELMIGLNAKKAELKEVEDKVAALNNQLQEMQNKKAKLEYDVDQCSKKLERAEKLISGLGGEKTRWQEVADTLSGDYVNLTGDIMLSAGYIAYLGAFTVKYRDVACAEWNTLAASSGIPSSDTFSLTKILGEPVKIRDWTIDGLPNDSFSIDNAIVMSKARRWPLMIDPQAQGNKWIKNMEQKNQLEIIKLSDGDFIRTLENCIQFGRPVLLENIGEELDASLEPLLLKSIFKQGGSMCIRLGDNTIEWNSKFSFYITTKLRNPHYLPEVSVKVTLLNFMITPDGLIDQLLGIVVARERPELQEEKTKLVLQGAENARQLKNVEDQIIEVLGSSEGSILESEEAINVISNAKELSIEINKKQAIAAKTEAKIDQTREGYRPIAIHVAWLFFNISELCNIEPMYQYSLTWYIMLFNHTIDNANKSDKLEVRLDNLNKFFTYFLYCMICRSLFEKDKLLFALTLCSTILQYQKLMDPAEYRFLVTGGVADQDPPPNKVPWQTDKLWEEQGRLERLNENYAGYTEHFEKNSDQYKHIYDSAEPQNELLPDPWRSKLSTFQKLLMLRTLRPDKLVSAITLYVIEAMGQKYVEPQPFDLQNSYNDSSCYTPLVFVLSPGSDPMAAMLKFSENMHVTMETLSLGQGQGPKAEKLIDAARQNGSWVVLQNCHLAVSWMSTLERICEGITAENTNPGMRLWLTSYPSEHFPVAVLQNAIKMTNEPPKGMRANLMQTYLNDPVSDPEFFNSCERPKDWHKLLFGLAFFHATVQERIKFGPLGWNIPYQFSDPDLKISLRQLKMFLNEFSTAPLGIPLKALIYLIGECNYGGRVTDGKDRRTLMTILTDPMGGPFNVKIQDDAYRFSPSGVYYAPPEGDYESYLTYIKALPIIAQPEVFGLDANADIRKDQQEVDKMFESVLLTLGSASAGGGGKSREEVLMDLATSIKEKMPPAFDLEAANYKYPVDYHESMNSVLCQELVRFNRLIVVVHKTLFEFVEALQGLRVMSGDLDALGSAMFISKIPALWAGKSYPSLKPLASYVNELIERLTMLQNWIDVGPPPVFWISGFFFTHAFLTGISQNFARKYKLPIDMIVFDFKCMPEGDYSTKPEDGAYVRGVFLEGCKWDYGTMMLVNSDPKVLFTKMAYVWFVPLHKKDLTDYPHYLCPLYRTAERRGVLATTGHSSNFVLDLRIPSDQPQEYWVKRGVAGLLSLSD